MDKIKLRTTMRPTEELEVSPEEATDLQRMGLVLDTKATTEKGLIAAAQRQVAGQQPDEDSAGQPSGGFDDSQEG